VSSRVCQSAQHQDIAIEACHLLLSLVASTSSSSLSSCHCAALMSFSLVRHLRVQHSAALVAIRSVARLSMSTANHTQPLLLLLSRPPIQPRPTSQYNHNHVLRASCFHTSSLLQNTNTRRPPTRRSNKPPSASPSPTPTQVPLSDEGFTTVWTNTSAETQQLLAKQRASEKFDEDLLQVMMPVVEELKAEDIEVIDIRTRCDWCNIMAIMTARGPRHMRAIADRIAQVVHPTITTKQQYNQ
jgi:hypothetical protein